MPHPDLCPEKNVGWQKVRDAYDKAREEIEQTDAEIMIIYSTFWPSILGHQIQAFHEPEWTYVDEEFHDLGSIDYKFTIDSAFAELTAEKCNERGLHARTVSYFGFTKDQLKYFLLNNNLLGIDRVVPIGKALEIDIIWDGYETIKSIRTYNFT